MSKSSNDEDETIEALRAARRPGAGADPRFRDLAMGTLPAEETEALRREAPDLYEIHRPFDEDEQARLFDRVQERLAEKRRVVPLASWRRRIPQVAAAFAVAAAAVFAFKSTRPDPLEVAWSNARGDSSDVSRLSSAAGARLTELIVPVRPIDGTIAVRGSLLVRPDTAGPGRVRSWPLQVTPTPDNEVILSGSRRDLFPGVESGHWDMVVVIGRQGPPLSDDEVLRLVDGGSSGDLRVLRRRVILDGRCVGTPARPCREDIP